MPAHASRPKVPIAKTTRDGKEMRTLLNLLLVAAALAPAGCKQEQEQTPGVYVEISLKNDTDIDKYVVFNPNIQTIKECEANFAASLPAVMAHLPAAIPKDSTATGWKCSLDDPTAKNRKK
jgi:hypothetical protein